MLFLSFGFIAARTLNAEHAKPSVPKKTENPQVKAPNFQFNIYSLFNKLWKRPSIPETPPAEEVPDEEEVPPPEPRPADNPQNYQFNSYSLFNWLWGVDPYVETPWDEPVEEEVIVEPSYSPLRGFGPRRLYLKHVEETGDGIGNIKNYTTFGILFAPCDYREGCFIPMLDLQLTNINGNCALNTYGASIGFIERYINCDSTRIWGVNAYYDYREGAFFHWNQLGIGFESLGICWDFRANAYFPLENKRIKKHVFDDYEGGFFAIRRKYEYAFTGFDAEVGYKLIRCEDYSLYAAAGPYYLSGSCDTSSWGIQTRLRPQYKDYLSIEFDWSYDSIYKNVAEIQIIFSIPLYSAPCSRTRCFYDREIYQPVERRDLILLKKGCCWESNF